MRVEVFERTGRGRVRPVRVAHCPDDRRAGMNETPHEAAVRLIRMEGLVERAVELAYRRAGLYPIGDHRRRHWTKVLHCLVTKQAHQRHRDRRR